VDTTLLKALARAHRWKRMLGASPSMLTLPRMIVCSWVITVLLAPHRFGRALPAKTALAARRSYSQAKPIRDFYR
jgi:hypothetical protein